MKIPKNLILTSGLLFLFGCQGIQLPQQFQNFAKKMVPNPRIKEFNEVVFEVKSCDISDTRVITCRLEVTSKFRDRLVKIAGGGSILFQDDAGNSYPVTGGFGKTASGARIDSVLVADTPYNVTLTASNVSSQATKVRAIVVNRVDLFSGTAGNSFAMSPNFTFPHPPMLASLQNMKADKMSGGITNPSATLPQTLTNTSTTGSDTLQNTSLAETPTSRNENSKMNITGRWLVTEHAVDNCKGTKSEKEFQLTIVQVGNDLTFSLPNGAKIKGTINGSAFITVGFVMPIPDTNGSITFAPSHFKIGPDANRYSGSGSWTFNMDSISCSGTIENTAARIQ